MMNHKILGFPIIKKMLNLKEIHSVEEHLGNDDLKTILDMFEGSDSIGLLKNNSGVIGIASRVQWAHPLIGSDSWALPEEEWWPNTLNKFLRNKGYKTITIRIKRDSGKPTEYIKRINSILNETSYPIYIIQQYVSDRNAYKGVGKLLSLSICKTKELILFIKNGKEGRDYELERVDQNGSAYFFYIKWDHYINNHNLWVYPKGIVKKSPQKTLFNFQIDRLQTEEV
jgi:hypothetical protein